MKIKLFRNFKLPKNSDELADVMKSRAKPIDPETYIFDFGKYKGEEYCIIRFRNPSYIEWCHDNVPWFSLDDDELTTIVLMARGQQRKRNIIQGLNAAIEYALEVYGNDIFY